MPPNWDRYSLFVDGQRLLVRSGAMHYFRLPHPDLWWDRLRKLKAGGYNTVDLYFSWDFHSPAPGVYDFTGLRDVSRLLAMVQRLGLFLIARPGPYINAETTRGGLPGWLLTQPGVVLRNREDGAYVPSEAFMRAVGEWFDQILPLIRPQPNLLMIQVENEYATHEMEPDYFEALVQMIRAHGITAPTMHNDFYAAGLYADQVDLYAVDNYSVTLFDRNWRTMPDLFSMIDTLGANLRTEICAHRPLMMAELQAGWFAGWKGVPYETIHESLGREHIGLVTRSFLGQGGTIFNHYKAVGGTNWGHLGATDAYTSYDFSAPISEQGLLTERFYEAKRINQLLESFDLSATDLLPPEAVGLTPHPALYAVRQCVSDPQAQWIFARNLTAMPQTIPLAEGLSATLAPYRAAILPRHVRLAHNGLQLAAMTVEPILQTPSALLVPGDQPATLVLQSETPLPEVLADPPLHVVSSEGHRLEIALTQDLDPEALSCCRVGTYRIVFLGGTLADRVWEQPDGSVLLGPDMVLDGTEVSFSQTRPWWQLTPDGTLREQPVPAVLPLLSLPALDSWTMASGVFPTAETPGFRPLAADGSDMDHNHLHQGAAWYRYRVTGRPTALTLHAQHLWAVFWQGRCLLSGHTFHVHPDTGGPEDAVTIPLPETEDAGPYPLLIYVESLGHHKGFYDDTREPRGVLSLSVVGSEAPLEGEIMPVAENTPDPSVTVSPIAYASCRFTLDWPPTAWGALGLVVDLDVERADIWLNGMLVGKYWRACRNQTRFYLPEGVLNLHGENHLTLALTNFVPFPALEKSFPAGYGTVNLMVFGQGTQLCRLPADTSHVEHHTP